MAAHFAARPPARFPRPSSRVRERRLGLRSAPAFRAASAAPTVLRAADLGPLVRLRAGWRAIIPAIPSRSMSGRIRPTATMAWTGTSGTGGCRPRAVPAPWRD